MENLKLLLERKNMSQKQLALDMKVSQPTVSDWIANRKAPSSKNIERLADLFGVSIDFLLGRPESNKSTRKKGVRIPVLGRVQAGIPIEAIEEIIGEEEISEQMARTGEFFALAIRGESMSPTLVDGDIVIVRKQSDVNSGEIAIVLVNGDDATCKKVVKHKDGLSLIPLNPAFEPMFYTNKEVESVPVDVIGKIVESRRTF